MSRARRGGGADRRRARATPRPRCTRAPRAGARCGTRLTSTSALRASTRMLTVARTHPEVSRPSCRPTPGWSSTCSSRARSKPSTRRWRRSRLAPQRLAPARVHLARDRVEGDAGDAGRATWKRPRRWPVRRWPRAGRRSRWPRPSTTRSSCSASAASRAACPSSRPPAREFIAAYPGRAGLARGAGRHAHPRRPGG